MPFLSRIFQISLSLSNVLDLVEDDKRGEREQKREEGERKEGEREREKPMTEVSKTYHFIKFISKIVYNTSSLAFFIGL